MSDLDPSPTIQSYRDSSHFWQKKWEEESRHKSTVIDQASAYLVSRNLWRASAVGTWFGIAIHLYLRFYVR